MIPSRPFIAAAGLCGAAGVALSAAAAHQGGGGIGTAANFMLFHAPVFLAVGLLASGARWLRIGAGILLAGLVVFSLDLISRQYLGHRLFPFAAPAGGTAMILGWLAIAAAGAMWPRGAR